jgi:predicted lipoprotein with Yx(FWY)xxD motif
MIRALALFTLIMASAGIAKKLPSDAPAGITFAQTAQGRVFATKDYKTLYSLSLRTVRSRAGFRLVGTEYCTGPCAELWSPLIAPQDAVPIGKWTILKGSTFQQWAYELNPVFTFTADTKAGDRKGDHYMEMWLAMSYVPPKPKFEAPAAVEARLMNEEYLLTDAQGSPLIQAEVGKTCDCIPFAAGMASLPIGAWSVLRDGDATQWAYQGAPVFVSASTTPSGKVLRP